MLVMLRDKEDNEVKMLDIGEPLETPRVVLDSTVPAAYLLERIDAYFVYKEVDYFHHGRDDE